MASTPSVIQGGMGIGVSDWRLARAVASRGQMGVVSGTAIGVVLARRLQQGDPGGALRRALAHLPCPRAVERVLRAYLRDGGTPAREPYRATPPPSLPASPLFEDLALAGAFAEVWLAKEGHAGPVGLNLLQKVQLPTLPTLYGALLAGVDAVLMGAGIPLQIPGALDRLAAGEPAELRLEVDGAAPEERWTQRFDPAACLGGPPPRLRRPAFLAIVSSAVLAQTLLRRADGRVDGFVVEGEAAGGHNAPPRGNPPLSARGEPVYGPRDVPDLEAFRALGRPFWLAGAYARPERLAEAQARGAAGIQVGTAFAYCDESGLAPELKRSVIAQSRRGGLEVFTDPRASPTGFPFKVLRLAGTLSEPEVVAARVRRCDLGYLRQPYRRPDGSLGYRCSAEPVDDFVRKGGARAATQGRLCICNGLAAAVGLAQQRADGSREPALLTAGQDACDVARWCPGERDGYAAADVLDALLRPVPAALPAARPPG